MDPPPPIDLNNRKEQVVLSRLRIGHTRLTHGYLMYGETPPMCLRCDVQLSVMHILVECPHLGAQRNRAFPFLNQSDPTNCSLRNILAQNSKNFSAENVFKFLKDLNIFRQI